ncbi:MAG: transglutaminase domain-containing protein [Pirellulaceae bacterium]|nr:transglutaminase domain-containing protein [Pirellulaceae bacterium]
MNSNRFFPALFALYLAWFAWRVGVPTLPAGILALGAIAAIGPRWPISLSWRVLAGGAVGLTILLAWLAQLAPGPREPDSWLAAGLFAGGQSLLVMHVLALLARNNSSAGPALGWGVAGLVCLFGNLVTVRLDWWIPLAMIATVLAALAGLRGERQPVVNHAVAPSPWRWHGHLAVAATLALVGLLAGPLERQSNAVVKGLQEGLSSRFVKAAVRSQIGIFSRRATLDSVLFEQQLESFAAVSVESSVMPGYLRGAAFDSFLGSEWRTKLAPTPEHPRNSPVEFPLTPLGTFPPLPRDEKLPLFALSSNRNGPWRTLAISNAPRGGEMFFTPLGCDLVAGESSRIWIDYHGIVRRGLNPRLTYSAFVSSRPEPVVIPEHARAALLQVPGYLRSQLRPLAREVCGSERTDRQKMKAVEEFFRRRFRYSSQGVDVPRGDDPISFFITTRPAAHCEYFATSAAMLLRLEGIPCRYVTGYLLTEESDETDGLWTALNSDAHAWVEAFDSNTRQWVAVEATPGIQVPDVGSGPANLARGAASADSRDETDAGLESLINRDLFRIRFSAQFARQVLLGLSASTLVVALSWLTLSRLRSAASDFPASPQHRRLRKSLDQLDRRLARLNIKRRPDETLHDFADRLRQASLPEGLAHSASWYEQYAQAVYSGCYPDPLPLESGPAQSGPAQSARQASR